MRVYPKGSAGFQPAAFGILPEASARAECNPTPAPARRHQHAGTSTPAPGCRLMRATGGFDALSPCGPLLPYR